MNIQYELLKKYLDKKIRENFLNFLTKNEITKEKLKPSCASFYTYNLAYFVFFKLKIHNDFLYCDTSKKMNSFLTDVGFIKMFLNNDFQAINNSQLKDILENSNKSLEMFYRKTDLSKYKKDQIDKDECITTISKKLFD